MQFGNCSLQLFLTMSLDHRIFFIKNVIPEISEHKLFRHLPNTSLAGNTRLLPNIYYTDLSPKEVLHVQLYLRHCICKASCLLNTSISTWSVASLHNMQSGVATEWQAANCSQNTGFLLAVLAFCLKTSLGCKVKLQHMILMVRTLELLLLASASTIHFNFQHGICSIRGNIQNKVDLQYLCSSLKQCFFATVNLQTFLLYIMNYWNLNQ